VQFSQVQLSFPIRHGHHDADKVKVAAVDRELCGFVWTLRRTQACCRHSPDGDASPGSPDRCRPDCPGLLPASL
jgi:hypothetical protein